MATLLRQSVSRFHGLGTRCLVYTAGQSVSGAVCPVSHPAPSTLYAHSIKSLLLLLPRGPSACSPLHSESHGSHSRQTLAEHRRRPCSDDSGRPHSDHVCRRGRCSLSGNAPRFTGPLEAEGAEWGKRQSCRRGCLQGQPPLRAHELPRPARPQRRQVSGLSEHPVLRVLM